MKLKTLFIIASLLIFQSVKGQELTVGDKAYTLDFEPLGAKTSITSTSDLKGKVILLDFWATWCGSCIVNMPHLDSLQAKFQDNLQIIAISSEEKDRLERFVKNRPFNFLFTRDGNQQMQDVFPHRMIPHSVLIDKEGRVVAITKPENINEQVIRDVINNEPIDLPLKVDNVAFDYSSDYFNRSDDEVEAFDIQPYNPNVPGFTKFHKDGRRITMHNTTITGMYREAFGMSSYRLVLNLDEAKVDWENTTNRYNVDILVSPEDKTRLKEIFKEKLLSTLSIKARKETREMEVIVLSLNDSVPFSLEQSVTEKKELNSRGDQYISNSSTLIEFADYLETYGILGKPVKDETGLTDSYQFDFSFDPENSQSFLDGIAKMGLKLKKENRKVEVLVIYEEKLND